MTTIVTPPGCSRCELNPQRAGGYDGESRSRAAKEQLRHSLARRSPKHGEVIDLVYFHGKSDTEVAETVGIAERPEFVATAAAIDGPTALGGLWLCRRASSSLPASVPLLSTRPKSTLGGAPPSNGEPLCPIDHRFAGR
jgi:hypothetical protein